MAGLDARKDGFNIEGLALSADGRRLLVGLRAPLDKGKALILTIENPDEIFDAGARPEIGPELIRLELGGAGIRSIDPVPELGGHLILAGNKGRKEPQLLWFWSGDPGQTPRPARIAGRREFRNGEGLTRAEIDGAPHLVIVSDDGDPASGRPGHYLVAPLEAVEIDGAE